MERPSEETIRKVVDGIATLEETATVVEWFATEEGQMYLSHEMDMRSFNAKEGYEELFVDHEIPSDKMFNEILARERRRKLRRTMYRAAAIVIPFILLLGLGWQVNKKVDLFGKTEYVDVYVPKGERLQGLCSHIFVDTYPYPGMITSQRVPSVKVGGDWVCGFFSCTQGLWIPLMVSAYGDWLASSQ